MRVQSNWVLFLIRFVVIMYIAQRRVAGKHVRLPTMRLLVRREPTFRLRSKDYTTIHVSRVTFVRVEIVRRRMIFLSLTKSKISKLNFDLSQRRQSFEKKFLLGAYVLLSILRDSIPMPSVDNTRGSIYWDVRQCHHWLLFKYSRIFEYSRKCNVLVTFEIWMWFNIIKYNSI